jgi:hypothetical protein
MNKLAAIADAADMIVNGYAFSAWNGCYRVVNLNRLDCAVVMSQNGEVIETSMDDIELAIVQDYFKANRRFLEDESA